MDIIKIKLEDGDEYRLPDISPEKFNEYIWVNGSDDTEYEKYKLDNGMKELTDFNSQTTDEITLIAEQSWRGRVLKFKCVYDSDNDEDFDEKKYFGEQDKSYDVIGSKKINLTYEQLFNLLKEAYRNGYATYEMVDAGLEPYDADGYARWVLLGMK